jgi:protease-4
MLSFLKYVLATLIGLILFFVVGIFLVIAIAMSAMPDKGQKIEDKSVLRLKLDAPISERTPDNFFAMFQPFSGAEQTIGLVELKEAIVKAKADSSIKGIYIESPMVNAGMATLQELRATLEDFKTSKKFIVAYGEFYTEKSYYLASVADKIFLPPTGLIEFNGLESQTIFLKGTLEKLDIKAEIFKVGTFKSAVEPLILDKMSDASRLQTQALLNEINQVMLFDIAQSRNVSLDSLKIASDKMLIKTAQDALNHSLITNMAYYDEVEDYIMEKIGGAEDDKINFVNFTTYRNTKFKTATKTTSHSEQKIAVIIANGEINSGKGDDNTIGSETLCEQIRNARKDKNIKAIVLRINSPGGSALASDMIWREVILAKKVKPIIASMSDVAASGGYYIAMACDTIVAQTSTITGSIGVFGVAINTEQFLKNKLGVTVDRVTTGEFSDIGSTTRVMTTVEKQMIQNEVERIYLDFTTKAADGRHIPLSQLQDIASGRVWTGTAAKENHLIDVFGNLSDAIKIAADKANIKEYATIYLPEKKNEYWEQLFSQLDSEETMIKHLGIFYPYFKEMTAIKKYEGIQTRMPFDVNIQ